ncbi:MAG: hypothetical protein WKF51_13660, partial [Geodermatophilaceae bacterium]
AAESGAPYAYANNTPHNAVDPTGEIAWFAVAAVAWVVIEIGASIADAVSTAQTFTDACSSSWDKAASGGLFAAGVFGPGGGYSTAGRAVKEEGGFFAGRLRAMRADPERGSIGDGTPRTNIAQNKQFNDAIKTAERQLGRKLTKDERSAVHREISGQDYGFHDIVDEVLGMFGGGG